MQGRPWITPFKSSYQGSHLSSYSEAQDFLLPTPKPQTAWGNSAFQTKAGPTALLPNAVTYTYSLCKPKEEGTRVRKKWAPQKNIKFLNICILNNACVSVHSLYLSGLSYFTCIKLPSILLTYKPTQQTIYMYIHTIHTYADTVQCTYMHNAHTYNTCTHTLYVWRHPSPDWNCFATTDLLASLLPATQPEA